MHRAPADETALRNAAACRCDHASGCSRLDEYPRNVVACWLIRTFPSQPSLACNCRGTTMPLAPTPSGRLGNLSEIVGIPNRQDVQDFCLRRGNPIKNLLFVGSATFILGRIVRVRSVREPHCRSGTLSGKLARVGAIKPRLVGRRLHPNNTLKHQKSRIFQHVIMHAPKHDRAVKRPGKCNELSGENSSIASGHAHDGAQRHGGRLGIMKGI
jgi:hypothetical protein